MYCKVVRDPERNGGRQDLVEGWCKMTGWLRAHQPSGRQTLAGLLLAAAAGAVGMLTFREIRRRRAAKATPEGVEGEQTDRVEDAPAGPDQA